MITESLSCWTNSRYMKCIPQKMKRNKKKHWRKSGGIISIFLLQKIALAVLVPLSFVMNFVLNSILSYMGMSTPTVLSFLFVWNIFLYTLTFSLSVSLALNWVSCKLHIEMSYFLIPISHLMTLIGAFSRLTFKVL